MFQPDDRLTGNDVLDASRTALDLSDPPPGPVRDMALSDFAPRPAVDGEDPFTVVTRIVERSRSSFVWGMRSLTRERREAIYAVYAFCRIVDDIADCKTMSHDQQAALLGAWDAEIAVVYEATPLSSVGIALRQAVERFDLPRDEFHMMLAGMHMDVAGPVLAPSMEDLFAYTRRVAGSVGKLSIRIFGVQDCPERDAFALALADALQLTNILRDVEEDAAIGRVYLPREVLEAHDLRCDDPSTLRLNLIDGHPGVPAVCAELGHAARLRFHTARLALPALSRASVRPALMMMGVYEGYLDRMDAVGFARDRGAHLMPRWQKLGRSLRYAYAPPRRPAPPGAPAVPSGDGR
ncbi:MAG: squalene/phytoene synthase family protein [Pseudomonadota bacterium]